MRRRGPHVGLGQTETSEPASDMSASASITEERNDLRHRHSADCERSESSGLRRKRGMTSHRHGRPSRADYP